MYWYSDLDDTHHFEWREPLGGGVRTFTISTNEVREKGKINVYQDLKRWKVPIDDVVMFKRKLTELGL